MEQGGEQMIAACRAAYRSMEAFACRVHCMAMTKTNGQTPVPPGGDPRSLEAAPIGWSSASVFLRSPQHIRVVGKLAVYDCKNKVFQVRDGRGKFEFVSNGSETYERWTVGRNRWKREESVTDAVAGFTGVSGGASSTLPALLLGLDWGDPFDGITQIDQVTTEDCMGQPARRLDTQTVNGACTFWIHTGTWRLLRLLERVDEAMLSNRMASRPPENLPPDVEWPKGDELEGITFSDKVETFTELPVEEAFNKATFTLPSPSPSRRGK